jgi:hypothetical protein
VVAVESLHHLLLQQYCLLKHWYCCSMSLSVVGPAVGSGTNYRIYGDSI